MAQEREEELPFATAAFDVVLSMHDLEYLPEKLVGAAMEELARVTTAHVLAVVNVCGNKFTTPHCPSSQEPGLQTLKSRAWCVAAPRLWDACDARSLGRNHNVRRSG